MADSPFIRKYKARYRAHKKDAAKRGIPFLLSFEQWLKIWMDSGHLHERGPRRGQYVMSRPGDKGPYAVGNVRIVTGYANTNERNVAHDYNRAVLVGVAKDSSHRAKIAATLRGRKRPVTSPEWCENLSKALKGKPKSKEARLAMSRAHKGKTLTAEHRRKIGESSRIAWAKWRERKNEEHV